MLRNKTIDEFKAETGATAIQIVRNPNTKKLFASAAGKNYRVQGDIDVTKPIDFLYEDDTTKDNSGVDNGCFVNSNQDNVVHSM
jgi:hypothetical protein